MNDCIFCKIVGGDIPSHKVYEDEHVFAFLDIHPVQPGHTLVIPKEHSGNIFEIGEENWVQVQRAVHRIAKAVEDAAHADGLGLRMNNREHGGQSVHHVHIHLIPRFKGDNLPHWAEGSYKTDTEAEEIAEKIRRQL